MRVLYLTDNADRASTTVATKGWFRYLKPRGLKPVIASPKLGFFSDWARSQGVSSYRIKLPFPNKLFPLPFLSSFAKLFRLVRKYGIDLIHCNEQNVYPIGQFLGRMCKIPVVATVHFSMDRGFCRWAFGGKRLPDRLFFVSQRNLDSCTDSLQGIVPNDRCIVVHNGLELDSYPVQDGLRQAFRTNYCRDFAKAIGVACALRPIKQLEHLFDAFERLQTPNVGLVVAGFPVGGYEAYAENLISQAKARFGSRFVFTGKLDDLRPFCNGLDIYVNSSGEESFGISVLEAMACGCPVVGYDSKAVDEVVLPFGGEITRQDDVQHLSQRIDAWLSDTDKLQKARLGARRQAERFDLSQLSSQLWSEYHKCLARTQSP